jgi:hypothetical protein
MFGCQPEQETPQYSLKISSNPTNGGTIVPSSGQYYEGEIVEIKAEANKDYVFHSWSGSVSGTSNTISVEMNSDQDIEANFYNEKYDLTLHVFGEGEVTSKLIVPDSFSTDVIVELTATPKGDWEFVEWSGDITSTENPVEVNFDSPKNITATFTRNFNYKVPSHDWENGQRPWMNVYKIIDSLNISDQINNTSFALADFNNDGYIDITVQDNEGDGVPVKTWFIINDTQGKFFVDQDFPLIKNINAISSRKTIVGDFNNDDLPDVVRPQGGHDWLGVPTIILSKSDGSYEFKLIGNGPETQPHTISSGDIDNDGDLDLFVAQAGEQDGFLINDGNANFQWKWISEIIEDFDSGYLYPNNKYGYYGFWSSEITDVDKDGYVDLILGGSYKDQDYDSSFWGPTVLWGDGSGKFYSKDSTILFDYREIDYSQNKIISLSHDYAVQDVDKDGFNDVVIFSECKGGGWLYSIVKGQQNRSFVDKTREWLPNPLKTETSNHVWVLMKDVDNNGKIDIVESETHITSSIVDRRKSIRWEWNGNKFDMLN